MITAIAGLLTIKTKMKEADTAVTQEQLEAKKEAPEEEKKETEQAKVIGEKPAAKEEQEKDTRKEVKEEQDTAEPEKEEDGPILIGGERPKQPEKKEASDKKSKKDVKKPAKKPAKKPEGKQEAQAADPGFQVESSSEQVYDTGNSQPPVQQEVSSEYILPISNQVYLTYADVDHLSLKEVNYAKNEIFARHGRKFASPELQNYFNSKSWYVGTIEPGAFTNDMLSSMEVENANFLATVEHNIDPNGYPLDQ